METGLLLKHFGTAWPVSFSLEITPPYRAQFVVGGACLAVLLLLQSGVLFITKLNAIFLGTIRITLICCTNNIYYAVCTYTSILVAHRAAVAASRDCIPASVQILYSVHKLCKNKEEEKTIFIISISWFFELPC